MPSVPVRLDAGVELGPGFDAVRAEAGVEVDFPADVVAEAEAAAARGPSIPPVDDLRDIPFVTIDPPGSRDLDQAVWMERRPDGFSLRYAIADVAAFVAPGGRLDAETRARGLTVYLPDRRAPLHPTVLSEGAASLLPGEERQALVWHVELDTDAEPTSIAVRRATVRSRRAYAYIEAQAAIDGGQADDLLVALRDVGRLRQAREVDRGGIDLPLPEQVVVEAAGRHELVYRAPLEVEGWNAQVSLLTGMCAARLMLDGAVGILRTLPAPTANTVEHLRRRAEALSVPWPAEGGYPAFVRQLDPRVPEHAALTAQAARLLRGAGYVAFDGTPPEQPAHAAVAAPYAHVTAPLRRLVDRFANETVLALSAGALPPDWVRQALPDIPKLMLDARRREAAADRMAVDLVEAATLRGCVGGVVQGVVVDVADKRAEVQLRRPAVVTSVDAGNLALGDEVRLRVEEADPVTRRIRLRPLGPAAG